MVANAFKKINVNVQKDFMDHDVNSVSFINRTKCYYHLSFEAEKFNVFRTINLPAKCQIPCINGGKCNGNNKCRCPRGFRGNHCEIEIGHQFQLEMTGNCKKPCRHGVCMLDNKCKCNKGWFGRFCNQRGN